MELTAPGTDISHAHNMFLQIALDVGIPGLAAHLSLLLLATTMCWRAWQSGVGGTRLLALGLWGNVVATHAFGLGDAIAPGAKVGIFW